MSNPAVYDVRSGFLIKTKCIIDLGEEARGRGAEEKPL